MSEDCRSDACGVSDVIESAHRGCEPGSGCTLTQHQRLPVERKEATLKVNGRNEICDVRSQGQTREVRRLDEVVSVVQAESECDVALAEVGAGDKHGPEVQIALNRRSPKAAKRRIVECQSTDFLIRPTEYRPVDPDTNRSIEVRQAAVPYKNGGRRRRTEGKRSGLEVDGEVEVGEVRVEEVDRASEGLERGECGRTGC